MAALTAGVLLYVGKTAPAAYLLLFITVSVWLLQAIKSTCVNYALDQVREIVRDNVRRTAVSGTFREILV